MKNFPILLIFFIFTAFAYCNPNASKAPHTDIHTVCTNEKFSIYAWTAMPNPRPKNFKWKREDEWQLESCPKGVELLWPNFNARTGELRQFWYFRAHNPGNYSFRFKRFNEYVTVPITVTHIVAPPEWQEGHLFHGTRHIDLERGSDYYHARAGDVVQFNAPGDWTKDKNYIWRPEDRWVAPAFDASFEMIQIQNYVFEFDNSLSQWWKVKVHERGVFTLKFTHHSRDIVITLKVD